MPDASTRYRGLKETGNLTECLPAGSRFPGPGRQDGVLVPARRVGSVQHRLTFLPAVPYTLCWQPKQQSTPGRGGQVRRRGLSPGRPATDGGGERPHWMG